MNQSKIVPSLLIANLYIRSWYCWRPEVRREILNSSLLIAYCNIKFINVQHEKSYLHDSKLIHFKLENYEMGTQIFLKMQPIYY